MSKEDKLNVLIGIGILVMCVVIVTLAFMSAIKVNKNVDNIIYIDNGSGTLLSIPKSNLVTEYLNIEKDIVSENGTLHINVKLPKINIETQNAKNINNEIYKNYQEVYKYITTMNGNETIKMDYSYNYDDETGILEIVINDNKKEKNGKKIYRYDVVKDKILKVE